MREFLTPLRPYTSGQQLRNEHAYPLGAVDKRNSNRVIKGEAATVTQQELVLAYQATLPGESSAFWSDTTVLAEQSFEDYSEGEVVRVQDTINISDVEQRQESLQDDFGGDVNVETMVLVRTQYEYTHPGKTTDPGDDTVISKSAEHTNKISFTEQLFVLQKHSRGNVIHNWRGAILTIERRSPQHSPDSTHRDVRDRSSV